MSLFEKTKITDSDGVLLNPADKENQEALLSAMGEVQETPTDYTLLSRLKDIWTLLSGIIKVQGSVASGGADSGNPVKMGGRYNSTPPTLTDGQRGDAQLDTRGNLKVTLIGPNSTTTIGLIPDNADAVAVSSTSNKLSVAARLIFFNGTTWDRLRGDITNGIWANIKSSVLPSGAATAANQTDVLAQYKFSDEDTSTAGTVYRGYIDKDGKFFIIKEVITTTARTHRYFKGDSDYATSWIWRASQTYDYFNIIF